MKDINKAFDLLKKVILRGNPHADYERTTTLKDEYLKLFTGEKLDEMIKKYHPRAPEHVVKQVLQIYTSVMPEVANNLSGVFAKVFRSNGVFASAENKKKSEVTNEIKEYASRFWFGENESGVDAYLQSRWFYYQRFDPNAFLTVQFANNDSESKKTARVFPVDFGCDKVWDFGYVDGELDYLIIKHAIKYRTLSPDKNENVWVDGSRYIMFIQDQVIQLTQVDPVARLTTLRDYDYINEVIDPNLVQEVSNGEIVTITKGTETKVTNQTVVNGAVSNVPVGSDGATYLRQNFDTKSGGKVPAKRVGYIYDPMTDQRTCVSIFFAAIPRFKKEVKLGSELDLSIALHLHPQKIMFGDPCLGPDNDKTCKNGKTPNGSVCSECNGTGMAKTVTTSAQDILWVPRPLDPDQWGAVKLSEQVHYERPDIEVIQKLYEMVNEITEKAKRAVFGGQAVEKKTVEQTATEADYSFDDVNDTVSPFARNYSAHWKFFYDFIAIFTDNASEDLIVYHRFPNNFKWRSRDELMNEAKIASESNMPQHIIDSINADIAEILYSDDPDTLTKIQTKNKFYPFTGKTPMEIANIIATNGTTKYNIVLYRHFNQIFQEIEDEEPEDVKASFFLKSAKDQKAIIKQKVDALIVEIDQQETERMNQKVKFERAGLKIEGEK